MAERSIRFGAVGDVSFGDHPLCVGFGCFSEFRKRPPSFPFEFVKPDLDDCDVLFGNLECTISQPGMATRDHDTIQMRGQPSFVDALTFGGFDVLNMANNHSLQHGEEAFKNTSELLDTNGIQAVGINLDDHRTGIPTIIEKDGIRLGFLGYSLRPRQYFTQAPIYSEGSRDAILHDTHALRSKVDFVIVSLHWGDEFVQSPSPTEINLAHEIIDAGGGLVIGHHPHVLRGIEYYKDGAIAYSLGNFVCDMLWDETLRETALLQCTISKNGLNDLTVVPCRINDYFQPVPLGEPQRQELLDRIAELSEKLKTPGSGALETRLSQYDQDADVVLQDIRRKSQRFFVRNIGRYRTSILLQQIWRFVRNRVDELVHKTVRAGQQ